MFIVLFRKMFIVLGDDKGDGPVALAPAAAPCTKFETNARPLEEDKSAFPTPAIPPPNPPAKRDRPLAGNGGASRSGCCKLSDVSIIFNGVPP
jgi:hypothetical protein